MELIFRNFVLLSWELFFYAPNPHAASAPTPMESKKDGGEVMSDPYGSIRKDSMSGKPNPASGAGAWDEGVTEM